MDVVLRNLAAVVVLAPLVGSVLAGVGGPFLGRKAVHYITIFFMLIACVFSVYIFRYVVGGNASFNGSIYTWGMSGRFQFDIGFLVDRLTAVMLMVVTFVSTIVHIYSVGYMADERVDQRFFSYMSLFTFAMLLLVLANNFLQLFIGWEGVGLVSYLLIGYYYERESAANGSIKAFLVNRVGDMGFVLGLAAIMDNFGTLDYASVFQKAHALSGNMIANATISIFPHTHWHLMTFICILLFIGAMAKSAQIPLHVWLPESMEGPTPISALIHAATMVTAGVYMVARLSPIYEMSHVALSMVLVIGATGALFLGLLAFVENDLKRIIAYSTMSQLGYMMAANGASAFSAGIFHLTTHACFKALLFLAAGSVIIAMHHEQDIRKMGNLKRYMPVTYLTFLIGALALAAIPPFAGFYSKDSIIEAVHLSTIPGAHYAYYCLLFGGFVTGYYIFRAFFLTFHTKERMSAELQSHLRESHWTITLPLILLAIPSVFLGGMMIHAMLFQWPGILGNSIQVLPQYNVLAQLAPSFQGIWPMAFDAFTHPPLWFALAGIFLAWLNCVKLPIIPAVLEKIFKPLYWVLREKYGFDAFNDWVFVRGGKALARAFFRIGDEVIIDGFFVDGTGRGVTLLSRVIRRLQTGYLYQYVLVMIVGVLAFLIWWIWA